MAENVQFNENVFVFFFLNICPCKRENCATNLYGNTMEN